jgi:hypothetical protein
VHNIFCNLPSWIQTIAAVCLVVLSGVTLLVLRKYAADTKRIADASASQTENSQVPFLAVTMRVMTRDAPGGWVVQNQGFGPALNVFYSAYGGGVLTMVPLAALGVGSERYLHDQIGYALDQGAFEMSYESLSGLKYGTTVGMEDGQPRTQFHRPEKGTKG